MIYTVKEIMNHDCSVLIGGAWLPARPLAYHPITLRFKMAFMAFTGKADLIVWPEQSARQPK